MTSRPPKVMLLRLFERTSAKGNRYFTGRLGSAKLIVFEATDLPDDQRYGAEVVWNVFVQGEQDGAGDRPPQRRDAPTRGQGSWGRSRDHDPPTGDTRVIKNERSDPRQERIDELASRFQRDTEFPF
jgi:hypothetical protein